MLPVRNNLKAGQGRAQAALGWSGPLQSQMTRSLPPPDRNGKTLKPWREADDDDEPGGTQCSHDVHRPRPSARMHIESSGPRSADAKRVMLVQNLTAAENMSGSIQSAILAFGGFFWRFMRLLPAECAGTAFADCDAATLPES